MAIAHTGTVITSVAIYVCSNEIKEGVNWKTTQELGKETTGFNAKTKFCQGSLKSILFGKQHAQGGCNDNPTNHPFFKECWCQYEFRQLWQQTLYSGTSLIRAVWYTLLSVFQKCP